MSRRGRRALLAAAAMSAAAAAGAPPAGTHSGHAPTEVLIARMAFNPAEAAVVTGDTVLWFWEGPDRNHTVTSDIGQSESFESDPGREPAAVSHSQTDGFGYVFRRPGRFTYHCRVHPSMRGTVVVTGEPVPDDFTAPLITALRVGPRTACASRTRRCRVTAVRVAFRLSEPASVLIDLERGEDLVRTIRRGGRGGANSVRISTRGLRPGRYRVTLVATDSQGNQSRLARRRFTVRRG